MRKEHNKVVTKDFNEIRNIIKDNAELSFKNPAYQFHIQARS